MKTLLSSLEYKELLRKKLEHQFLSGGIGLLIFGVMMSVFFYFIVYRDESLTWDTPYYLFITIGFFPLLSMIQFYLAYQTHHKIIPHFSFTQYEDFQTPGTKVPVSRLVSDGENTQTIYGILELNDEDIVIFDLKKKGSFEFMRFKKEEVTFRFHPKLVDGIWTFKTRIDLKILGKVKLTVYGIPPIQERLYDYLKSENYQLEIKERRQ